jgi:hypothetical protein
MAGVLFGAFVMNVLLEKPRGNDYGEVMNGLPGAPAAAGATQLFPRVIHRLVYDAVSSNSLRKKRAVKSTACGHTASSCLNPRSSEAKMLETPPRLR